jgi:hypothetical protein
MHEINVPYNFLKLNKKSIFELIEEKEPYFFYNKSDIENILTCIEDDNITEYDTIQHQFLYLIYKICNSNDYMSPLNIADGGIPTGGLEFVNK